ncbi:hypothetical protein PGT21_013546 [Puccinia graminis f. sp. tritici]|uniref:Uncharacterized protein n=1 Tax=Puccinia graminis f. sp. tritici TaxID=56615 RepID=A0A5B0MSH2_PUCGR|nr:hypothetical protein PGT21_013546 [Puccinia graminis f. sp. tritici]
MSGACGDNSVIQASSFSADTQLRPKSPDVRVLSKEERIQLLVKRTRSPLEEVPSGSTLRRFGGQQSTPNSSARQSARSPEIDTSSGGRGIRQGLEPLDREEKPLPSSSTGKKREEPELLLPIQLLKSAQDERPASLEKTHESLPHPRVGLHEDGGLDLKILTAILDSLDLVNKNLSAIDSNAESNFKSIFDNMLRNPLSINPEATKLIAENTAKSQLACSKLTTVVDNLSNELTSTDDYILSKMREDALLAKSANNKELDMIKDLLIQQNIRSEGIQNTLNEQMTTLRQEMRTEIQNNVHTLSELIREGFSKKHASETPAPAFKFQK